MNALEAIQAKIKELTSALTDHKTYALKLQNDLGIVNGFVHKIEGALEAFGSLAKGNSTIENAESIAQAVSGVLDTASGAINTVANTSVAAVPAADASGDSATPSN